MLFACDGRSFQQRLASHWQLFSKLPLAEYGQETPLVRALENILTSKADWDHEGALRRALDSAEALRSEGLFRQALDRLKDFTSRDAEQLRGRINAEWEDRRSSGDIETLIRAALEHLDSGRAEQATEILRKGSKRFPPDGRIETLLATAEASIAKDTGKRGRPGPSSAPKASEDKQAQASPIRLAKPEKISGFWVFSSVGIILLVVLSLFLLIAYRRNNLMPRNSVEAQSSSTVPSVANTVANKIASPASGLSPVVDLPDHLGGRVDSAILDRLLRRTSLGLLTNPRLDLAVSVSQPVYHIGDKITVTYRSSARCYCALLHRDAVGHYTVLDGSKLPAGLHVFPPQGWIKAVEPIGVEDFILLGSSTPTRLDRETSNQIPAVTLSVARFEVRR